MYCQSVVILEYQIMRCNKNKPSKYHNENNKLNAYNSTGYFILYIFEIIIIGQNKSTKTVYIL